MVQYSMEEYLQSRVDESRAYLREYSRGFNVKEINL